MDESTTNLILRLSMWIKILGVLVLVLAGVILLLMKKMGKLNAKEVIILAVLGLGTFVGVLFFTLQQMRY